MTSETILANNSGARRWLFVLTIFVGSFLLFLVQPMVARMALPQLGGAPAVWNSAMLVYQALLLGGYAYAHWIGRFAVKQQASVHLVLLGVAALWLPVGLANMAPPAAGQEALWVPLFLAASIGPVFFVVAAQAPLMQRWFAADGNAADPYALYAASNLGSFSGLISYPLLVEPLMPLATQSVGWAVGYGLLALLVLLTARARWNATGGTTAGETKVSPRPTARQIIHWLLLAAVPSGLMLSTTTHLTTDIFAMPLMWVIPLGLYLLSFVFAFGNWPRTADTIKMIAPAFLLIAGGLSMLSDSNGSLLVALASLIMLFVVSTALHAHLYDQRPATDRLTLFYLVMSAGGVLGGLFAALIAPLLFDWVYEHPILVLAAALLLPLPALVPWAGKLHPTTARFVVVGLVALAAAATMPFANRWDGGYLQLAAIGLAVVVGLAVIPWRWAFATTLALIMFTVGGATTLSKSLEGQRTRSYFGVYTVRDDAQAQRRMLAHGTTLHGMMLTAKGQEQTPTTYYSPQSGVGLMLTRAPEIFGNAARVGIVGLGTGTLACYRQPGQSWDFYEIDQAMVDIAKTSGLFAFVPRCTPDARMIVGDARIELAKQPTALYDVLAIDAFSSDAIPLHLLTGEAFGVYARSLKPGGILLVHISNRFFNLEPVLAEEARQRGWATAARLDVPTKAAEKLGATGSTWVAFSADPARLAVLTGPLVPLARSSEANVWVAPRGKADFKRWTDDYASILPVVYWNSLFPGLD